MKAQEAHRILSHWDKQGLYLFSKRDLAKLFDERGNTLTSTVQWLEAAGILERMARGLFLYRFSERIGGTTIEDIAAGLRRGEYSFVSLESAASLWGFISQIPVRRLTVMTTGREGEFRTPYGTVEFVHTDSKPEEILESTIERPGHPLRLARKERALRDLLRCHRSEDLIDWEKLEDGED